MLGLTRWSPFGSVFQLHRELDDLFSRFFGQETPSATARGEQAVAWWPAMESYSRDGEFHVRLALPGVDPKDVEVSVTDSYLTIRGSRKSQVEEGGDGHYFVREFAHGAFERTIALPEGVDPGKVQAKWTNGMLEVTMPAPLAVAPKKVEIQIEGSAAQPKAIRAA
jgi:HSP20 family protein